MQPLTAKDGFKLVKENEHAKWIVPASDYAKSAETYKHNLREKCK